MSSPSSTELATIQLDAGVMPQDCSFSSLVFFVTGNPGLIDYYTTYLATLQDLLQPQAENQSSYIHIYGQSLAGFSDDTTSQVDRPYSLEEQIQKLEEALVRESVNTSSRIDKQYDNIILMGHSVGSYILLELIRRNRASSSPLQITAGILLFPTITHIAQSPSGQDISRLFKWRNAPRRVGTTLQRVFFLLPEGLLVKMVALVTRMPIDFAKVTTRFLKSRMGIWQALHMARDEMESITEDRWDADIWGAETETSDVKSTPPKLIFYFGQDDHWVADHTRDALIAARGRGGDDTYNPRPTMLIDQDRVPHGFCLKHGEIMAEKTKVWIQNILWPNRVLRY